MMKNEFRHLVPEGLMQANLGA